DTVDTIRLIDIDSQRIQITIPIDFHLGNIRVFNLPRQLCSIFPRVEQERISLSSINNLPSLNKISIKMVLLSTAPKQTAQAYTYQQVFHYYLHGILINWLTI